MTALRVLAVPLPEALAQDATATQWSGLLAPAGTPREVITRLHKEVIAILRTPETRERLRSDGSEVVASSPEEFAAFIQAEIVKWAKVVNAAGIQPE